MGDIRAALPAAEPQGDDGERNRPALNMATRWSIPNPLAPEAATDATTLFARLETLALLLALFLFATGGAFLVAGMEEHAKGSATVVSASGPTGLLHSLELAVALGISLFLVISRWRSALGLSLRMWPFTASAVLAVLSSLWSIDPLLSLRSGLYLLLNTLLVYYLVQRYTLQGLLRLMMGLGVVVAVLSIATAIVLPSYALGIAGSHWALQGAFVAKNVMGNVAVLLLTPVLFLRNIRFSVRAAYIFVFLGLIALSFSIQAWAATLFCFGFAGAGILLRRLRNRDAVWLAYVTLLPAAMALLILVTYRIEILGFLGKDPTLSGRTVIWDAVLRSIAKRPVFGWGYNAFWQGFKGESADVFLIVHFPIAQSQNGPLEVLLALGGVGLGIVLTTFVQGFRNLLHCFRLGAADEAAWYLLIILLTIYYSIGEAYFQQPNSLGSMMYILACTGLFAEAQRAHAGLQVLNRGTGLARSMPLSAPAYCDREHQQTPA
jgi:exopolysaccharide production protein ExoQ